MAKKTKPDPTGQRVNRNRLTKKLDARLKRANREIKALFRAIPRDRSTETVIVNKTQAVYTYDITPEQQTELNSQIQTILNEELLETQDDTMPPMWWYKPEIELPVRQGTLEEVRSFNLLITAAIAAGFFKDKIEPLPIPPLSVLTSRPYLQNLRGVYAENFQVIKSLSTGTANQVIQQINSGIGAGLSPTEIAGNISERFDVASSNAKRIAETEVNKAYTNAKLDAVDLAAEQSGLNAGVIHISALLATTRPPHAARHGNAYTTVQQRQWWETGSNRIFCHCTIESVLLDSKGQVVEKEEQLDIKNEGREFFAKQK